MTKIICFLLLVSAVCVFAHPNINRENVIEQIRVVRAANPDPQHHHHYHHHDDYYDHDHYDHYDHYDHHHHPHHHHHVDEWIDYHDDHYHHDHDHNHRYGRWSLPGWGIGGQIGGGIGIW